MSAAGFQLKGSGWYATDFRNGSKPAGKTPTAEADGAPRRTAPATAKTDAKPSEAEAQPTSELVASPTSAESTATPPRRHRREVDSD